MTCAKCSYEGQAGFDGGCPECLRITLFQLDTLVVDERGREVWAKTLAERYRREMTSKDRW